MKLLALDTSGLVAAVAVVEDGRLLAEFRTQYKKTHSQMLMPMLDALGRAIDLDMRTLDAVAVAAGPGSFTGLRIGAATAKGLAYALNLPIVPVPSLDALAWQLFGEPGIICPMMDARRSQVYTGLYRFVGEGMETVLPPCAIAVEEAADRINALGEQAVLLGDGVPVYEAILAERLLVPFRFAPPWKNRQSAVALADLAARMAARGETVSADGFAPTYLRASQAEREAAAKASAVTVREMAPADAAEAAALEAACLGREAWKEGMLREAADRRDSVYLMAESGGAQIAHAGLRCICGEGEIGNVCVAEGFRRRGIAERLLRELIRRGGEMGARDCTLEVRAANTAARALYEKLGFCTDGVRPGFYADPQDDAVIMWLHRDGG